MDGIGGIDRVKNLCESFAWNAEIAPKAEPYGLELTLGDHPAHGFWPNTQKVSDFAHG
jgi:hypothetical protein